MKGREMTPINTTLNVVKVFGGPAVLLAVLGFMGTGIVENDRRNTDQHTEIRSTFEKKFDVIKEDVTNIRVQQAEQRTILERIDGKL